MAVTTTSDDRERSSLADELVVPDYPPIEGSEREKAWHEWMGIAVGLTGLLSILAIIVSIAALGNSGSTVKTTTVAGAAAPAALATQAAPTEALPVSIKTDVEHGKLGPDSKWHDAFLPANFTVHAGDKVTITYSNYDSGPHSFVSPSLGVDQVINGGGTAGTPQLVKFTFTAPKRPGHYAWWCGTPCDPWAMSHVGYMRGIVTVKA